MRNVNDKRAIIVLVSLTMMVTHLKSQTNFISGKQFGSEKDEYALNHVIDNRPG